MASPADRSASIAAPMHDETSWTLIKFGMRSAVFALRQGDPALLESGICGFGLASQRHQPRDVSAAAAKLVYVAERLGIDPNQILAQNLILQPHMRDGFEKIAQRPREPGWQIRHWGFREVDTELGIGFVEGSGDYAPTIDLLGLALRICRLVERDPCYPTTDIQIERTNCDGFRLAAGIGIFAQPNLTDHSQMKNQRLRLRLMEFASAEEASGYSGRYQPSSHEVGFALAAAKWAVTVAAHRSVSGMPNIDTNESVRRFVDPLTSLLRNFPRYRWRRWQAWEGDGCITLTPRDNADRLRHSGAIESQAKMLYDFSAATGEEAATIHYERQGWGPYRPQGNPVPCPHNCGCEYYPQGYGDCPICGHLG